MDRTPIELFRTALQASAAGLRTLIGSRKAVVPFSLRGPGVSRRYPNFIRHGAHARPAYVHAADQFRMVGFPERNELIHAFAHSSLKVEVRVDFCLACVRFERLLTSSATAVVVDDGISQQPVEPRNCVLVVADLIFVLNTFDESVLKDLLGVFTAADAGSEKVEEPTVIRNTSRDRCIGYWGRIVCAHCSSSPFRFVAPYHINFSDKARSDARSRSQDKLATSDAQLNIHHRRHKTSGFAAGHAQNEPLTYRDISIYLSVRHR